MNLVSLEYLTERFSDGIFLDTCAMIGVLSPDKRNAIDGHFGEMIRTLSSLIQKKKNFFIPSLIFEELENFFANNNENVVYHKSGWGILAKKLREEGLVRDEYDSIPAEIQLKGTYLDQYLASFGFHFGLADAQLFLQAYKMHRSGETPKEVAIVTNDMSIHQLRGFFTKEKVVSPVSFGGCIRRGGDGFELCRAKQYFRIK